MRRWWRGVVARVLGATFPGTEAVPGITPTLARPFLERLSREAPRAVVLALHGSVLLFLVSPPWTVRRLRPALRLTPADLDRHAQLLANHRSYAARQSMTMIKTMGGLCWGADDEVRQRLDLAPYQDDPGTFRQGEPE